MKTLARPFLCAMCSMQCVIVCASKSLFFKACAPCAPSPYTGVRAGACTCMRACVRRHVHVHAAHSAHSAHPMHINHLRVFHAAQHGALHNAQPLFERKEMEGDEKKLVIACTPENADQFRAAIRCWPMLQGLVKSLQDGGHFPGLRAMQFTLTGSPDFVQLGLADVVGALTQAPAAGTEGRA